MSLRISRFLIAAVVMTMLSACNSDNATPNEKLNWLNDFRFAVKNLPGATEEIGSEEKPWLELNAEKGVINGFAGCNKFSGKFTSEGEAIKFENIITTKMMCPAMDIENIFLSNLGMVEIFYTNPEGDLVFATAEREELMVLSH